MLSFVLSINRQFYEVGAGLGVPAEVSGGWQSLWCGDFHFQMSHFFRSSVPVGKAQPWALNLTHTELFGMLLGGFTSVCPYLDTEMYSLQWELQGFGGRSDFVLASLF